MARTLVLIISSAVKIIELEAHSEFLSRVHCKQNLQVFLAVGTVACRIERHICYRRKSACEVELRRMYEEIVVWLHEYELILFVSVGKDTILSWCSEVAKTVIFATQSGIENGVHIHVRHRVRLRHQSVAETFIDSPHLQSFRNFLVFGAERVALVIPFFRCPYLPGFVY